MYSGIERRKTTDLREDIDLTSSIFGEGWQNELREIDKHEIIVKICQQLGPCPSNLSTAEQIFDSIKFDITRFVMHHIYSRDDGIRSRLLLWLDSKTNPDKAQELTEFIEKYMK